MIIDALLFHNKNQLHLAGISHIHVAPIEETTAKEITKGFVAFRGETTIFQSVSTESRSVRTITFQN
jgi:hypothetical protein